VKAFWFSTSENICKILFANSNVTRTSVNVLVAALVKHWRGKTFHETVMSKIGKKNTWSRCFTTKDWTMLMGLWHLSGEWQQWQQWDYTGRPRIVHTIANMDEVKRSHTAFFIIICSPSRLRESLFASYFFCHDRLMIIFLRRYMSLLQHCALCRLIYSGWSTPRLSAQMPARSRARHWSMDATVACSVKR